jgi:hypothetical protein
VAGPWRRRIIAVLALVIGLGAATGTGAANAAPTHTYAGHVTISPQDWWW